MGTDISLYVEIPKERRKEWQCDDRCASLFLPDGVGVWDAPRDYPAFAILAGVRNYLGEITPIAEPRGLPPDVSQYVRDEYESIGGYGESWLTAEELKTYPHWDLAWKDWWREFVRQLPNESRIVFWFDC